VGGLRWGRRMWTLQSLLQKGPERRGRGDAVKVSLVVDGMMVRNPAAATVLTKTRHLLQLGAPLASPAVDGFTFDCSANTPWRPVGCGPLMAPISHFHGRGRRG
jgi:hypothetical protein